MQEIWGWLPAIDLFLGGLGAGAFLVAAIVELTGERYRHDFCPTTLVGAGIGGPAVLLGTVVLIFDLGAGKRQVVLVATQRSSENGEWPVPVGCLDLASHLADRIGNAAHGASDQRLSLLW